MIKLAVFSLKMFFAIMLLKDWKDKVKFWSAISLFCASLFEVTEWMHTLLLPYAVSHHWGATVEAIGTGYPILFFVQETGMPYAFLMAGLAYYNAFSERARKQAALALLVPPALSLLALDNGLLDLEHPLFLGMAIAYLLATVALMAAGVIGRRGNRPKRKKIAEAAIIIPNVLALLVFHYGAGFVRGGSHWQDTVLIVVAVTFALFLVVISRSGILGIKLRLERQVAANTFRSVTTGTALLNHSIKNRLTNIDLLAERILERSGTNAHGAVSEDVALIHSETGQLLEMIKRIQHRTEAIVLNEQACPLSDIIQEAAAACALYQHDKKPQLLLDLQDETTMVHGDRVHLQEMLVNLLHNALDALPEQGGTIRIAAERTRNGLHLEIRDNGTGIAADQLRHIMEPFYSTKDRSHNFGLGLTYCTLVVEKHGGTLEMESSLGRGTAVRIQLPARRIAGKLNQNVVTNHVAK